MPRNYFRKTNPTIASDRQAKPPLTKATKGLIVLGVVAALALSYSLGVNNGTNSEKNALIASEKATYDTELATECSTLFGAVAVVDRQFSVTVTSINDALSVNSNGEVLCDYHVGKNSLILGAFTAKPKSLVDQHGVVAQNEVTYRATTGQVWVVAASTTTNIPVGRHFDAYLFEVATKIS